MVVSFTGEGNGASRENHRPAVAKLYHMMLYRAYIAMCRTRIHNFIT